MACGNDLAGTARIYISDEESAELEELTELAKEINIYAVAAAEE